jgi:hypothetical protein
MALVAACVDAPRVAGPGAARTPRFAATDAGAATTLTGRHIVSFSGAVPADFEQRASTWPARSARSHRSRTAPRAFGGHQGGELTTALVFSGALR